MDHNEKLPIHLIASNPNATLLALGFGNSIAIFDIKKQQFIESEDLKKNGHSDTVREIEFNSSGEYFVSVGDDKLVKVWQVSNWKCLGSRKNAKKLSAATFGPEIPPVVKGKKPEQKAIDPKDSVVLYADKFGDVFYSPINDLSKQTLLLGHCCSIMTQITLSPERKYIITSDRDEKIRVSHYPAAYNIEEFCLGHTSFVCSFCLVTKSSNLLVSGSGDATIRLWNYPKGELLHTVDILPDIKERNNVIVRSLAYSPIHDKVIVLVESNPVILIFSVSKESRLELVQTIKLESSILLKAIVDSTGTVWIVGKNPLIHRLSFNTKESKYDFVQDATVQTINQKGSIEVTEETSQKTYKSLLFEQFKKKVYSEEQKNLIRNQREEEQRRKQQKVEDKMAVDEESDEE